MIPCDRQAVLLLDSPKPGPGRPNEICCLIIRATIVNGRHTSAAQTRQVKTRS
jgi:hypothetical protein